VTWSRKINRSSNSVCANRKERTHFTSGRLRTKSRSTGFLLISCCATATQNDKPPPQKNSRRFFLVKPGCKVHENISNRGNICHKQNVRTIACNRMYTQSFMGRSGVQQEIPRPKRILNDHLTSDELGWRNDLKNRVAIRWCRWKDSVSLKGPFESQPLSTNSKKGTKSWQRFEDSDLAKSPIVAIPINPSKSNFFPDPSTYFSKQSIRSQKISWNSICHFILRQTPQRGRQKAIDKNWCSLPSIAARPRQSYEVNLSVFWRNDRPVSRFLTSQICLGFFQLSRDFSISLISED
jgi:hypothetical protein